MPSLKNLNFKIILPVLLAAAAMDIVLFLLLSKNIITLEENGFIENIQVVFLFLSMIFFLLNCFVCNLRSLAFFGTVVCFAFILRELDVERLDVPNILKILGSGVGRNTLIILLAIFSLIFIAKESSVHNFYKFMKSNFLCIILLCGLFLALSGMFDKNIFQIKNYLLVEELSEITAYFMILLSAFIFFIEFRKS